MPVLKVNRGDNLSLAVIVFESMNAKLPLPPPYLVARAMGIRVAHQIFVAVDPAAMKRFPKRLVRLCSNSVAPFVARLYVAF